MEPTTYDIITVGGGLAGAALAKTMAEHGGRKLFHCSPKISVAFQMR